MSRIAGQDLSDLSILDLFRMEVEAQSAVLTQGLLGLEKDADAARLKELMRAAHSLKGAARIVGRTPAVHIAHAMEDCFVAAQKNKRTPSAGLIDVLLAGVDLLGNVARVPDDAFANSESEWRTQAEAFLVSLASVRSSWEEPGGARKETAPSDVPDDLPGGGHQGSLHGPAEPAEAPKGAANSERTLRITAHNLDRLMGLAGEARLTTRWLEAYKTDMLRLKGLQRQLGRLLDAVRESGPSASLDEGAAGKWHELRDCAADCQRSVEGRLSGLDHFERRLAGFSARLYHAVLDCRMRPFSDAVQGFDRMTRDIARALGKRADLEIKGESTPVDRDILERLKAPLDHLVRNALDHGIELPAERLARGKPDRGSVRIEACHSAGILVITVQDDGYGLDPEAIRKAVVHRKLTTLESAQKMTRSELFEFLFLPGFTLKLSVSEISGRGVGLDVVQTMAKEVGGRVRISSETGRGTCFHLELPLTLSVVRTLLVEIAGDPFAFPLARIERALKLPRERIDSAQGRQHFTLGEEQIGLVAAHQTLDLGDPPSSDGEVCIVVLGENGARHGLVVDRFLGEQELVVRTLDSRLGKVKNISSAALMPDGSPVLIIDVDDLKRCIENLVSRQSLSRIAAQACAPAESRRKRVLVVDDSLTVRELERKLLGGQGYDVDVAVDGMDGWNAVRTGHYDLVLTDVDMPRLDGVGLIKLIRGDARLRSLPTMIVSYKDRPEDRQRGLEAGADYYLTKASFHDETLARVVGDLIGGAAA